jgi:hypothetical protein
VALAAITVGSLSYGASILLDTYALRLLGAAREAAFFATAPFIGAVLSVPLLGDHLRAPELGAALLMAAGIVLLVREKHSHVHTHDPIEHEHVHVHDDHHQHAHDPPTNATFPSTSPRADRPRTPARLRRPPSPPALIDPTGPR